TKFALQVVITTSIKGTQINLLNAFCTSSIFPILSSYLVSGIEFESIKESTCLTKSTAVGSVSNVDRSLLIVETHS
ncbi:hypothetical protein OFP00_33980, partial [Escherichia coli]|nr:hypothetical protein [Escherichia coli]